MRLNSTVRAGFALLLALMLPLQGYAAMPVCGQHGHSNAAAGASPAQHHCTLGPQAIHLHGCGDCCCGTAAALTYVQWIAPRLIAPEISGAVPGSAPSVTLDRLDRPPRLIPA